MEAVSKETITKSQWTKSYVTLVSSGKCVEVFTVLGTMTCVILLSFTRCQCAIPRSFTRCQCAIPLPFTRCQCAIPRSFTYRCQCAIPRSFTRWQCAMPLSFTRCQFWCPVVSHSSSIQRDKTVNYLPCMTLRLILISWQLVPSNSTTIHNT